uniref:Uncharacterized protein n=1 Tax=Lepeophtheirus salmonis TaxID=72036 RepID=A0A0K2U324_LEPSM
MFHLHFALYSKDPLHETIQVLFFFALSKDNQVSIDNYIFLLLIFKGKFIDRFVTLTTIYLGTLTHMVRLDELLQEWEKSRRKEKKLLKILRGRFGVLNKPKLTNRVYYFNMIIGSQ